MSRLILLFFALLIVFAGPALSADLQIGFEAAKTGDFATALREFRPLAVQGNPKAQVYMGMLYAKGNGVSQDHKIAFEWFKEAANQGFALGQYKLGNAFLQGLGVGTDLWAAVNWYKLAAENDFTSAQINLGIAYDVGAGVEPDPILAHMWFGIAASKGSRKARKFVTKIGRDMTLAQIDESIILIQDWIKTNRKKFFKFHLR